MYTNQCLLTLSSQLYLQSRKRDAQSHHSTTVIVAKVDTFTHFSSEYSKEKSTISIFFINICLHRINLIVVRIQNPFKFLLVAAFRFCALELVQGYFLRVHSVPDKTSFLSLSRSMTPVFYANINILMTHTHRASVHTFHLLVNTSKAL